MRLFSDHILSRNASNFIRSHLDFKKISRGEITGPLLTGAGEGREVMGKIKGLLPLGREGGKDRGGTRGMGGEKEGRGGLAVGGSCSNVLGGIDAPASVILNLGRLTLQGNAFAMKGKWSVLAKCELARNGKCKDKRDFARIGLFIANFTF